MKYSLSDKFIIGISSIIFIISLYFIFFIQSSLVTPTKDKIFAVIEKPTNFVQKRTLQSLNWYKVYNNSALSTGEYIFTGDDSSVTLKQKNGNILVLGQNTLIRIPAVSKDLGISTLELERGQVGAKLNEILRINLTKKYSVVVNGTSNIRHTSDKKIHLDIIKGHITLEEKNEKKVYKSNIMIGRNHIIKVKNIIKVESFFLQNESDISIRWIPLKSETNFTITLYTKNNKIIKSYDISQSSITIKRTRELFKIIIKSKLRRSNSLNLIFADKNNHINKPTYLNNIAKFFSQLFLNDKKLNSIK